MKEFTEMLVALERMTLTTEEAAHLLGSSRTLAYERACGRAARPDPHRPLVPRQYTRSAALAGG